MGVSSDSEDPHSWLTQHEQVVMSANKKVLDFSTPEVLMGSNPFFPSEICEASLLQAEFPNLSPNVCTETGSGNRVIVSKDVKDEEESAAAGIIPQENADLIDPLTGLLLIPEQVLETAVVGNPFTEEENEVMYGELFGSIQETFKLEEAEGLTSEVLRKTHRFHGEGNPVVIEATQKLIGSTSQMENLNFSETLARLPRPLVRQLDEVDDRADNSKSSLPKLQECLNFDIQSPETNKESVLKNLAHHLELNDDTLLVAEANYTEIGDLDDVFYERIKQLYSPSELGLPEKESTGIDNGKVGGNADQKSQALELRRNYELVNHCTGDTQTGGGIQNLDNSMIYIPKGGWDSRGNIENLMDSEELFEHNDFLDFEPCDFQAVNRAMIQSDKFLSLDASDGDDVHLANIKPLQVRIDGSQLVQPNFNESQSRGLLNPIDVGEKRLEYMSKRGKSKSDKTECKVSKKIGQKNNTKASAEKLKLYKCEDCREKFDLKEDYKRHRRRQHPNPKTLKCDMCPMMFSLACNLAKHKRAVHFKEKKFMCSYPGCFKRFGEKNKMKKHVASVHEAQKNFQCDWRGCNQRFGQKSDLTRHISIIHNGVKQFECLTCGEIKGAKSHFGRKSTLAQHLARVHSMSRAEVNDCFESGEYHTQGFVKFTKVKPTKPPKKAISKTRTERGRKNGLRYQS